MVISTPAKVVSGVAAASTAVAGTALVYKYSTSLYSIENLALDTNSVWKIKTETGGVAVLVKASDNSNLKKTYGVSSDGTWTCILKTDTSKQDELKNKLKEYFGVNDITTNETTATPSTKKSRANFVDSCSKNRNKSDKQTNNKVTSEIQVDSTKLKQELETIFGEIPLNSIEKKVYEETNLSFVVSTLTVSTSPEPKKVTGNIQVTITGDTSGSWTCNIEGSAIGTTDLSSVNDTTYLKTVLGGAVSKVEDRKGLVKSCARNRTSEFSSTTVSSTLKLNVSKKSEGETKLKFDDSQITQVFKGTWVNPTK